MIAQCSKLSDWINSRKNQLIAELRLVRSSKRWIVHFRRARSALRSVIMIDFPGSGELGGREA